MTRGIISLEESFTAWAKVLEFNSRTEASREWNPWVNFKQHLLEYNQILTERFSRISLFQDEELFLTNKLRTQKCPGMS